MTFDQVFTLENLYRSAKNCCKGVRWKASTQHFEAHLMQNVVLLWRQLRAGTFRTKGFHEFNIKERGKERHIKSVHITERAVQKCFCDYCLIPLFRNSLIYDNGATIRGRGLHFAVRRMKAHTRKYYRENGTNKGYVLLFDVSKYFDSIDHDKLVNMVATKLHDGKLLELFRYLVKQFGSVGLGLGSQISQVSALLYLSALDHEIKDRQQVKFYGRYMDDGYIISKDKSYLNRQRKVIEEYLKGIGLTLNAKKTQIVRLDRGYTMLKRRVAISKTGRLTSRPYKRNILVYIRKLRKLIKHKASKEARDALIQTFRGYLKEFKYKDRYTLSVQGV